VTDPERDEQVIRNIGGSVFIRNAIKYDYCILESIKSILPLDQVVVLDCQSDDGTTEMLEEFCKHHSNIKFVKNAVWECAPNFERLAILANIAISHLDGMDWHFMIQADEVLHESSIRVIRNVVGSYETIMCRRIHVWKDFDHQIRHDIPNQRKPASDQVIRLGKMSQLATGDAENLEAGFCNNNWTDKIVLFHYGFVRKNEVLKVSDMQKWFNGPNIGVDPRIIAMQGDGIFRPEVFFDDSELCKIDMPHPIVARDWVNERRKIE
jgi:glycosyltransferase involved in cell wall biosynthesis